MVALIEREFYDAFFRESTFSLSLSLRWLLLQHLDLSMHLLLPKLSLSLLWTPIFPCSCCVLQAGRIFAIILCESLIFVWVVLFYGHNSLEEREREEGGWRCVEGSKRSLVAAKQSFTFFFPNNFLFGIYMIFFYFFIIENLLNL